MYEIDVELKSITTPSTYTKTAARISGETTIEFSEKNDYSFVGGFELAKTGTQKWMMNEPLWDKTNSIIFVLSDIYVELPHITIE